MVHPAAAAEDLTRKPDRQFQELTNGSGWALSALVVLLFYMTRAHLVHSRDHTNYRPSRLACGTSICISMNSLGTIISISMWGQYRFSFQHASAFVSILAGGLHPGQMLSHHHWVYSPARMLKCMLLIAESAIHIDCSSQLQDCPFWHRLLLWLARADVAIENWLLRFLMSFE